ncbi:unnamed protein product, partial [Ectocarpus sp. 8 AP-2014]
RRYLWRCPGAPFNGTGWDGFNQTKLYCSSRSLFRFLTACGAAELDDPAAWHLRLGFGAIKGGTPSASGGGSTRSCGQGGEQPAGHHEVLYG